MADKQKPSTIGRYHAAAVHFHAFSAREAVNHQELVERIFHGANRTGRVEIWATQHHVSATKLRIEPRGFVRHRAQRRRGKIKTIAAGFLKQSPQSAGTK